MTLILDDGTNVQATVANGWFVAWWPGAQDVKSADAHDAVRHFVADVRPREQRWRFAAPRHRPGRPAAMRGRSG